MGLRDLFETTLNCPTCHRPWARRTLFGRIRCPNAACKDHDPSLASRPAASAPSAAPPRPATRREQPFRLGPDRVVVRYRNFRGEEKRFEGDPRSLRFRRQHVSVRVAPTGKRIALAKKSIANLDEIERVASKIPGAVERKILTYHGRRGTSSARYEELRRKYPDWSS